MKNPNPNPTFTELGPNTNLILKKYSEPEQNQTLIIKEPEGNTSPKFCVFFPSLCNMLKAPV